MGLFKDMRKMTKQAKDLQESTGYKRPSMREGMQMATDAMAGAQQSMEASQELMENGTPSTATVSAIRPTQQVVNMQPVIEFDLQVATEAGEVPVSVSQAVPQAMVPQVQPGATVNVLVDPEDTDKVMITFG
jgi:hypothetical protein